MKSNLINLYKTVQTIMVKRHLRKLRKAFFRIRRLNRKKRTHSKQIVKLNLDSVVLHKKKRRNRKQRQHTAEIKLVTSLPKKQKSVIICLDGNITDIGSFKMIKSFDQIEPQPYSLDDSDMKIRSHRGQTARIQGNIKDFLGNYY